MPGALGARLARSAAADAAVGDVSADDGIGCGEVSAGLGEACAAAAADSDGPADTAVRPVGVGVAAGAQRAAFARAAAARGDSRARFGARGARFGGHGADILDAVASVGAGAASVFVLVAPLGRTDATVHEATATVDDGAPSQNKSDATISALHGTTRAHDAVFTVGDALFCGADAAIQRTTAAMRTRGAALFAETPTVSVTDQAVGGRSKGDGEAAAISFASPGADLDLIRSPVHLSAPSAAMPRAPKHSTRATDRTHARHRKQAPLPAGRTGQNLAGTPLDRAIHVQARLSEGLPTNYSHFMERWGVSRSTVKRDLRYMRDRLNMPIEWDNTKKTFYFSEPFDALPALILGPQEALTLALAGRMCDAVYGSTFGTKLDEILRKIAPLLGSAVTFAVDSLAHVHAPPPNGAVDDFEHFLPLLEAIIARRELRLHYTKPESDAPEARVVHPHKLVRRPDQRWTLVAHDTARDELRTFVLGRIDAVDTTGRPYRPDARVDIDAYVRRSMGAFASTEEHEVRLALDAHAAYYARERPWHGSQRLTDRADGRVEMTMRVNHLADVRNAVLRWGDHVEALAPAELRADVIAALDAARARYARR